MNDRVARGVACAVALSWIACVREPRQPGDRKGECRVVRFVDCNEQNADVIVKREVFVNANGTGRVQRFLTPVIT